MKMKNMKHLLTLLAAAALAVSAWAQSADDDYQGARAPLVDKNAKVDPAAFPQMSKAIVNFLCAYPGDKRAPGLVNDTLNYGIKLKTASKTPALAQSWYMHVQNDLLDKQIEPNMSPEAKGAMAALMAAMAEGEVGIASSNDNLNAWRTKLDKLLAEPAGAPFVLDREKSYYNAFSMQKNEALKKLASDQLTKLSQNKDKGISDWAKQEMKYSEIKKAPFTLSVTTIDGKKFDTAALKGGPNLFLYFWSISDRRADANLKSLGDWYKGTARKSLEVLAVCCDDESKRDDVNAFIKTNKLAFPVYFDGKGKTGDLYVKLGVSRTPIGFLFDGKGNLSSANYNFADHLKKQPSNKNNKKK